MIDAHEVQNDMHAYTGPLWWIKKVLFGMGHHDTLPLFLSFGLASIKNLYIDCFEETNTNDGHAGVSLMDEGSSLMLRVVCKL